jgi:putative mRNA 3-end processing factor
MSDRLIRLTRSGLFCEAGGFHIDPSRGVELALITHSHSDHARRGSRHYVTPEDGVGLLKHRLGESIRVTGVRYGEKLRYGRATISFHPAGHILGSSQIRVECDGQVWVVSGDYKRQEDPTCRPFEVVSCDTFVSEATFGNPKYLWSCAKQAVREIHDWWMSNREQGRNSLLYCYAVGKTQRVLGGLAELTEESVHLWGEAVPITEIYRNQGVKLVPTVDLDSLSPREKVQGELIIAAHRFQYTDWLARLGDVESAFASGWMKTGAWGMRRSYDRGFVLSDHADWNDLVATVRATGARRVFLQHTKDPALARHLRKLGLQAELMGVEHVDGKPDIAADSGGRGVEPSAQLSLF